MGERADPDEINLLLAHAAERALTARAMFSLLDADADGYVSPGHVSRAQSNHISLTVALTVLPPPRPPQLGLMLTSMLLSQGLDFDGNIEDFALQLCTGRGQASAIYTRGPTPSLPPAPRTPSWA